MRKIVALIMAGISLLTVGLLYGCTFDELYPTYEDGFFVYYRKGTSKTVDIVGLTELGHQQRVIVVPETLGGYTYMIRDSRGFGSFPADWGDNNTLEKIYFEYEVGWQTNLDYYDYHPMDGFSALKKIIINEVDENITLNLEIKPGRFVALHSEDYYIFTNYANYNPDRVQKYYEKMGDPEQKGIISFPHGTTPANVEFVYNYDEAPNGGYYWIDDIDDGEKVEIIPPDPKREGYTFGGWYCEPECENEWSFDTVINKPEPTPIPGTTFFYYPENLIYFIYAKWIEN